MNSIKCPECNLTNWATVAGCQRCGFLFRAIETDNSADENVFGEQDCRQQNYRNQMPPNYQYYQPTNLKTGLAIASMILGILSIVTSIFLVGILLAPIGLILGIIALVKAIKKPEVYGGKGFAIAGIVAGALIVLILPIIAAIAIPNFLAARRSANEASAISSLRKLGEAENDFMTAKYSSKCGDLAALSSQKLIDSVLAKGEKNGYRFAVNNLPIGGCEIHAVPISASTGTRSFYLSTEDDVIRAAKKNGKFADKTDLPLVDDAPNRSNQPPKIAVR